MQNGHTKKVRTRRKIVDRTNRKTVVLTVPDVPISVHNKMKRYRLKIMGRDNRKYNLMQAYTESLKEFTKRIRL